VVPEVELTTRDEKLATQDWELTTHNSQLTKKSQYPNLKFGNWALILGAFLWVVSCEVVSCGVASADSTTQPDSVTQWFSDLSNSDAAQRERAKIELMGISRNQLAELAKLIERKHPLAPSQALVLHEIVVQVYLANEPYVADPTGAAFLGVRYAATAFLINGQEPEQLGTVVQERVPGFCAYRYLQDGDVIVGFEEMPDRPIRQGDDLRTVISNLRAGDTVHVQIIRGGQKMTVPLKLDGRPAVPPQLIDDAMRARRQAAEDYWTKTFAPLVDEGVS
jgi:hypothetical protein